VELSKIKLEIYDLLGTVVPGLLTMALALVCVLGWSTAFNLIGHLSGSILTASPRCVRCRANHPRGF
jgi:hypothetical protein